MRSSLQLPLHVLPSEPGAAVRIAERDGGAVAVVLPTGAPGFPHVAALDITHAVNTYKPMLAALYTIRANYPKAKADANAEGPLMRAWAGVDNALLLARGDDRNLYPEENPALPLLEEALRLMPADSKERAAWAVLATTLTAKLRRK